MAILYETGIKLQIKEIFRGPQSSQNQQYSGTTNEVISWLAGSHTLPSLCCVSPETEQKQPPQFMQPGQILKTLVERLQ